MADFNIAVKHVLKVEGGYSDNPHDSGGKTKYGITQKTFDEYQRKTGGDQAPVQWIDIFTSRQIYKKMYWNKARLDEFKDQKAANIVFDQCVNAGVFQAVFRVQHVLAYVGRFSVRADGIIGPKTLASINEAPKHSFCLEYIKQTQLFYTRLVQKRPKDLIFISGWIRRTHLLLDLLYSS